MANTTNRLLSRLSCISRIKFMKDQSYLSLSKKNGMQEGFCWPKVGLSQTSIHFHGTMLPPPQKKYGPRRANVLLKIRVDAHQQFFSQYHWLVKTRTALHKTYYPHCNEICGNKNVVEKLFNSPVAINACAKYICDEASKESYRSWKMQSASCNLITLFSRAKGSSLTTYMISPWLPTKAVAVSDSALKSVSHFTGKTLKLILKCFI